MMDLIEQYKELTEKCYPAPPKSFFSEIKSIVQKYPHRLEHIMEEDKMIGGCFVLELGKNIYGISGVVIDPKYQGKGYGKKLMEKIHKEDRGIFILKCNQNIKEFYLKIGYKVIKQKGGKNYMVYINNSEVIDF